MEAASQNRRTVSAKIAELYARYPLTEYVWIMPRLDTASELPEHLDLMVQTRKFSLVDGDVYPVNASSMEKAKDVGLSKSSLMALAADAGIKWPPDLNRRADDGTDPDIIEWKSTGILAGLSGMTPVTATKRIDLGQLRDRDEWKLSARPPWNIVLPGAKWDKANKCFDQTPWGSCTHEQQEAYIRNKVTENDMQRREFKVEMAETKAQLRVIRAILGIPSKFDKATVQNKSFAVLRIIFAPNAQTPEERRMILQSMSNMYLGAYPGAEIPGGAAQIETGDRMHEIEHRDIHNALPSGSPAVAGGEESRQSYSPPVDMPEAEVIKGDGDPGDPPPEEGEPVVNYEFLKAMKELKEGFIKLLGKEGGAFEYYAPIHVLGFQKSNQIVDEEQQKTVYRKLWDRLSLLTQNAGQVKKEPEGAEENDGGDDIWIYKPIRSALGEFTKEALEDSLTGYYNEYAYPIGTDPMGIKAMLTEKRNTKGALIEAHVLILKWNKEQGGK